MAVAILQRYKIKSDYHLNTNVTVILEAKYFNKIVRGKLCKTISGNELSVDKNIIYRMVFEQRRKRNNVVPGRYVESERTGRNTAIGRCILRETDVIHILLETINLD